MYLVKTVKFTFESQVDMLILDNESYIPLNDFVAKQDCVLLQVVKVRMSHVSRQVGIFLVRPHEAKMEA